MQPNRIAIMLGAALWLSSMSFAAETEEGFVPLFDGKSLDGWFMMGLDKQGWAAKDGVLAWNKRGGGYIGYDKPFGDFILRLEFKVGKRSNSGIILRTKKKSGIPHYTGFEVQIYDDHGEKPSKNSSGSIYNVLTPMRNMAKPTGQWNAVEVTCKGPLVKVVYNGFKVIDTDFSKLTEPIGKFRFPYSTLPQKGYIYFQDHGHPVWFRNIRIKELK